MSTGVEHVFLNTIVANMKFTSIYLITELHEKETKNKKPYTVITLKDKSGQRFANMWSPQGDLKPHTFVIFNVSTRELNGAIMLDVENPVMVEKSEVDINDFIDTDKNIEVNKKFLVDKINTLNDELSPIIKAVYTDKFIERFSSKHACLNGKYAKVGGLLAHTVDLVNCALDSVKNTNKETPDEMSQLVLAAALMSEVGTSYCYDSDDNGIALRTVKGELYGEVALSYQRMITTIIDLKNNDTKLNDNLVMRLTHAVLSSRSGEMNPYNISGPCVILPQTLEAVVLAQAYSTLERTTRALDIIGASKTQDFVPSDPFTSYDPISRRRFLKQQ